MKGNEEQQIPITNLELELNYQLCFLPLTLQEITSPLHTFELSTSLSTDCQRLSEHIIVNLSILKTISWCLEKCPTPPKCTPGVYVSYVHREPTSNAFRAL